mgnify:CR=1 FL=1
MSLLELLLVIALLALAAATVAASVGGGWDGWRLRSCARELGTELRLVRAAAMASGQPQRLLIDPAARVWRSSAGRSGRLPPRLDIRVTGARQAQPQAQQAAIVFFPDGASSGGRVDLGLRGVDWRVDVVWISGEVRVWRVRGEGRG